MAGELKNIRNEMRREWTDEERIALARKYRGLWNDSAKDTVKKAAMQAGIEDKYSACADEYLYDKNDWKGFVSCLVTAAREAGLKDAYKALYH